MKTYVYVKPNKKRTAMVITANGRTPDNCDHISAIGRPPEDGEIIGWGENKKEAFEDALTR